MVGYEPGVRLEESAVREGRFMNKFTERSNVVNAVPAHRYAGYPWCCWVDGVYII